MNPLQQQFQMAKQAYAQGDFKNAVTICDQLAIRLGERDDLLNVKAMSLLALGQIEAAEVSIRKALKINSRIAGMHLNAAKIYKALSLNKKIKRHAMEAVRLASGDAFVLHQAALLHRDCNDYSQALRIVDRCLKIQPGFSQAWHLKGSALIDLGRVEEAQAAFEESLVLDPGNVRSLNALVNIRGDDLTNTKTIALLDGIRNKGAPRDRATATFTLAKMFHRDGQYDEAFKLYVEANVLTASCRPFDIGSWEQKISHAMQASAEPGVFTASESTSGSNLVFIIGMPRSGTTLCEQVLSVSPNTLACGELETMAHIEQGFSRRGVDPYQYNQAAKDLEQSAALYLSALPKNYHRFQCVTDKAPMNFERVGLIHMMFPQARFLYCKRHPLDTILSCFMQNFQAGLTFAFNLEHITKVYIAHAHIMRHWMKLLPEKIHVVNYEQYVNEQEAETRVMSEFLNIDFGQEMLTPHRHQRAVTTASNLQIRQAVYTSSIGRWKNYRSHLTGIIAMLQQEGLLDKNVKPPANTGMFN